jgi:hypothetical protein
MTKFTAAVPQQSETGFVSIEQAASVSASEGVLDGRPKYEQTPQTEDETRRKEVHQWLQ